MTIGIQPVFGRPGIGTAQVAQRRNVSRNGAMDFYPAGGVIEGTKARDPGNTSYSVLALRAGLLMGKITSGGFWANSVLGLSDGALTSSGTTLTVAAEVVTELVRRVGASGTFKLTGPPTAAGTVRTLTVTYSAASGTSITITALGVNEVQTLTFGAAATGGTLRLHVPLANGSFVTTGAITWDTTDATYLSNINTALDAATGVTGGIVATGAAPDTALTFTFSGTGYAALPQPTQVISVHTFPTSTTTASVARTTTGVDGRFVTVSLVQPTDGSETIRSMIPDGYGIVIPDDSADVNFPHVPCAGTVDAAQVINWPSDASLKTYIRDALNTHGQGVWVFSDKF